jgi:hypothetical protein
LVPRRTDSGPIDGGWDIVEFFHLFSFARMMTPHPKTIQLTMS